MWKRLIIQEEININLSYLMKAFYYITTTIIAVLFVVFLFLVGKNLLSEIKGVHHIEIQYVLTNNSTVNDSILLANQKEIEQLVAKINEQEMQLKEHYELFLKAREEEADLTKILSCLGAFVLTILAFFGINSYRELQENVIKSAEEKASVVAKDKADKIAKTLVEQQINKKIQNNQFGDFLKSSIIEKINTEHLIPLETKLNRLEEQFCSQNISEGEEQLVSSNGSTEDNVEFESMGEIPPLNN